MNWAKPKENLKNYQYTSQFERQTETERILIIEATMLRLHSIDNRSISVCENRVGVIMLREENDVRGEKPIAMPLGPPQLTYGMTWGQTRFSSMPGQCLIARNMPRLVCLLKNVVLIRQEFKTTCACKCYLDHLYLEHVKPLS